MILYPAIDIKGGKAVRLRQGDFERATVFADDPVALALQWRYQGAEVLHIVDLDGALTGGLVNIDLIDAIVAGLDIPVEYGGGIRDRAALERVADSGVHWIVLGTAAVTDDDLLEAAVSLLGERLVVGLDCSEGFVATHGWRQRAQMSAGQFARQLEARGVRRVLYTDVTRDGMLEGPNIDGMRQLSESASLEVIMSGGVGTVDHLRAIRRAASDNVVGVIVGRALYEGRFTLAQAAAALA